jgi:hypothetical protein
MTTPPRITTNELVETIQHIRRRHVAANDPTWGLITTDPRDVLDYLADYAHNPANPEGVRSADAVDRITLTVWLWWDDRRRERDALRDALHLLHASQVGAALGMTTRQGARDRLDRLDALLRYDRPDEKLTRDARREAASLARHGDARAAWIATHHVALDDAATRLLDAADRHQVAEREWLDELAADQARGAWTPGSIGVLGLAITEIRTAPTVLALPGHHTVFRALAAADRIRADFARIGA